jgi:hypothetical protein
MAGLSITNCVVSFGGAIILNNPTKAELFDDLKPTLNITITGGTKHTPLVKNKAYKITGTVSNLPRTWLNMKCDDTGDPAKFKLSQGAAEEEE